MKVMAYSFADINFPRLSNRTTSCLIEQSQCVQNCPHAKLALADYIFLQTGMPSTFYINYVMHF